MYAVEKKFEIEMKLRKEMTNIQELKAAANRSSSLAGDVCNVLGACEQRLQQLETAVLPLYGDTARLQHIHQNMERTVRSLDHVINYYMVTRELSDLIQTGPQTSTTETLNVYLEALDKLADAQGYFNKNNPQSVELENINQLYNAGVGKLETAFEELLSRNTRPLSPTTLMDMIALEEDSSVESISVSGSGTSPGAAHALEAMRAAAAWLSAAGAPPAAALLATRAPAARSSLQAFKDYLRSRSMAASPLMRAKNLLHRSDSAQRRTSKLQKVGVWVSVDASDKMLKHALKARWDKRKDHKYDEWIIEEANWETLPRDIETFQPGTLFDAVICLGNSFAHLLDEFGDLRVQKMCLANFAKCLKPGGLLFIDHRNYDAMIDSGATPGHSIYYNCKYPVDIKTSVLVVRGKPELVALDYCIDMTSDGDANERNEFRLCYYPHKLDKFTRMLDEAFEERATHHIYADFKPLADVPEPAFYIHVLQKAAN